MPITKARLKHLRRLTQRKYREETGLFLVEGARLVQEAAESSFEILEVYHTADFAGHNGGEALLATLHRRAADVREVSAHEMEIIAETVTFQGVLAIVRRQEIDPETVLQTPQDSAVVVAFDAVSDPGNLGTMVRTCDWFGVRGILVGNDSVDLYNPKVVRGTMGGVFHLPIAAGVDLAGTLPRAREKGYTVYVTGAAEGTDLNDVSFAPRSLLVFGNEAWGVSAPVAGLADVRVSIRRHGRAESLNVSVACGVTLAMLRRPPVR